MSTTAYLIIGYLGAAGSLIFGANQLVLIFYRKEAKDVSVFDYAVRVVYSILLGVYSMGVHNTVFILSNFGAAILSLGVTGACIVFRK